MSFTALLYTVAAVAFFILMLNRPAVEPPNAHMQVADSTSGQANSAVTITAVEQTDSTAEQGNAADGQQDGSATQASANTGTIPADSAAESTTDATVQPANGDGGDSTATQADASGQTPATQPATDGTTQTASSSSNATAGAALLAGAAATQAANAGSQTGTEQAGATETTASVTPDYARERRISDEIRDAILEGEIFYLNDGSRNFMSIQTDADERRGGALILHGRGFHPDWEDTVNPLRTGLAENGWTTLSLQMPVLAKDAKYNDYVPLFAEAGKRIQAGIRHLKQQGISPITIVAHSCGAHMAMQWIRDNGDADIAAYVGLGMGATDAGQQMTEPFPLDKMQIPVFDVYGENDFPAVLKMAPERWTQITTAGNLKSEQRVVPTADHYFTDKGDELVGLVSTWLNGL